MRTLVFGFAALRVLHPPQIFYKSAQRTQDQISFQHRLLQVYAASSVCAGEDCSKDVTAASSERAACMTEETLNDPAAGVFA